MKGPAPTVQYGGVIGALFVTALLALTVLTPPSYAPGIPPSPVTVAPVQVVNDAATPDPTPTPTPTRKATTSRTTVRISATERVRRCIVHRESRGIPTVRRTDGGTASGLYGFVDETWQAVTGRTDSAWQAPARVQTAAFYALWNGGKGRSHWNPDADGVPSCW